MKIGIITIIDKNYGNRLQNYAAQEVLTLISWKSNTQKIADCKKTWKIAMSLTLAKSEAVKNLVSLESESFW